MGEVSWGWSSVIGFVSAAAAVLVPMLGELADATAPLGLPSGVWVIVAAVLTTITVLGRMWQAAAAAGGETVIMEEVYDPMADPDEYA